MEGGLGQHWAKQEINIRNNKNYLSLKFIDADHLPYWCLCNRTFLNTIVMPVVGSWRPNIQRLKKKKYFQWRCEKVFKSQKLLTISQWDWKRHWSTLQGKLRHCPGWRDTRKSSKVTQALEPWQCWTPARCKVSKGNHHAATFQFHSKSLN